MCMCASEKAFGFCRTERSSFLLLCNLIGKIQAATHTHTHTHTHTQSPSKTHMHLCTTQICSICASFHYTHKHKLVITICCPCLPIVCLFVCVYVYVCVWERQRVSRGNIYYRIMSDVQTRNIASIEAVGDERSMTSASVSLFFISYMWKDSLLASALFC